MRTYIIGAGFSHAVANAPLMWQLWDYIKVAYEKEKCREGSSNRVELFEKLNDFINKIELLAKARFNQEDQKKIYGGVRENLEYLLTLLDIHHEYSAHFKFDEQKAEVCPYPVIPFPYIGKIEYLKNAISTYLYIVFQDLKENEILNKFTSLVKENDSFINFNYDLLLEKGLWDKKLWSPLGGYIGINSFEHDSDLNDLDNAGRISKTYIYKMHGSLMFFSHGLKPDNIKIKLDNYEKWDFFFKEFHDLLSRAPKKPSGKVSRKISKGYLGTYHPHWILPSFVKPFDSKIFYSIWRAAFDLVRNTEELHIIGYSFRPEDTNGQLLLLNLSENSKVILVDPNESLKNRIENIIGKSVSKYYKSIIDYICEQQKSR